MNNYTCDFEKVEDYYREAAKNISSTIEILMRERGFEDSLNKTRLHKHCCNPIQNFIPTSFLAEVRGDKVCHLLKIRCTGLVDKPFWKVQAIFHVGSFSSSSFEEFSLEDHFNDFTKPTELELDEFEMLTGHPYMLSSKFFEGHTKDNYFEVAV